MQACPPLNCLAAARSAAIFCYVGRLVDNDRRLSSQLEGDGCESCFAAAAAITSLPTRVLPVKKDVVERQLEQGCCDIDVSL